MRKFIKDMRDPYLRDALLAGIAIGLGFFLWSIGS